MVAAGEGGPPRQRGDPEADAYVLAAVADAAPADRAAWLREAVGTLREEVPEPPWAQAWMAASRERPPWFDEDRLCGGQRFFDDWCLPVSICLFCASLPKAYAARFGVQTLARMSQLNDRGAVGTRVSNTGRMLLDITAPGGLAPGGVGLRRLRRVRLLHATARALVEAVDVPTPWPRSAWGVPINQEDQIGTLLSFTVTVLDAMTAIGLAISTREAADHLYLWSLVGWELGTEGPDRLLDPDRARALQADLEKRVFGASHEGQHLMGLLVEDMRATLPRVFAGLPAALVRRLAGAGIADILDLPESRTWDRVLAGGARIARAVSSTPAGRALVTFPSRRWGRTLLERPRGAIDTAATRPLRGTR